MKSILLILIFCLFNHPIQSLDNLSFKDINGNVYSLNQIKKNNLTVFVFLSPECPLCKSYAPKLISIQEKYSNKKLQVIGVFSGNYYTTIQYRDFAKEFGIEFLLLNDDKKILCKQFKAKVTPEVVVLDEKQAIRYQGRIDNWAYEIGKKRKVITEHNLIDAIESLMNVKKIDKPVTTAVGCLIE